MPLPIVVIIMLLFLALGFLARGRNWIPALVCWGIALIIGIFLYVTLQT